MNWPDVIVRTVAGLVALPVLYLACCVYEDEEEKLQSRLEDWWLHFDDLRKNMVTRHVAFASVISGRTKNVLDRIFGGTLFSRDSVTKAACLCVGSYILGGSLAALHVPQDVSQAMPWAWGVAAVGPIISLCCMVAVVSPAQRGIREVILFLSLFSLACSAGILVGCAVTGIACEELTTGFGDAPKTFLIAVPFLIFGGLAIATAYTLLAVSITRRSLAVMADRQSEWSALSRLLFLVTPIGVCFAWLYWTDVSYRVAGAFHYAIFLALLATTGGTAIAGGALLLLVAAAIVMMFHRAVWPLMSRLLYVLPRHHMLENKKALVAIGIALAGVAIRGDYGLHQVAKFIGL